MPLPAKEAEPYGGSGSPCAGLMRTHDVEVVYGPGTFLNRAVAAVNSQVQALLAQASAAVSSYAQAGLQAGPVPPPERQAGPAGGQLRRSAGVPAAAPEDRAALPDLRDQGAAADR